MKISISISDATDISHKLNWARKQSGLSNQQIVKKLEEKFGESQLGFVDYDDIECVRCY